MKHIKLFESFGNVGDELRGIAKSLTNKEKSKLVKLVDDGIADGKKVGLTNFYIDIRSFGWGEEIALVVKAAPAKTVDDPVFKWKGVADSDRKITKKVGFEHTTGSYDGQWDESTFDIDTFRSIMK